MPVILSTGFGILIYMVGSVWCSVTKSSPLLWSQAIVHGILQKRILEGCHFLLQGIFLIQELNPGLLHCRHILYWLSYEGRPSISIDICESIFYILFKIWIMLYIPFWNLIFNLRVYYGQYPKSLDFSWVTYLFIHEYIFNKNFTYLRHTTWRFSIHTNSHN